MRKIMFIGRSEAGKTTLSQAMKGKTITYHKTQYVNHYDVIIDTPGEYLQSKNLISALAVFTAEADVIGLLMDATEAFSLYSPNLTPVCNREGEGIADILSYLKEERDTLPWEEVKSKYDELGFGAGEDAKDQDRFHNI